MNRTRLGYMVIEWSEEFEQPLGLKTGKGYPEKGILDWTDGPRFAFLSRADAWDAIKRTEHYRLAFDLDNLPERKYCKVVPIEGPVIEKK